MSFRDISPKFLLILCYFILINVFTGNNAVNAADIQWHLSYIQGGDPKVSEYDTNIIYIATNPLSGVYDILKSSDRGISWKSTKNNLSSGHDINYISTYTKDSDTVALSIWLSGVYLSENGGNSWVNIFPTSYPRSVAISPKDKNTIYVGIGGDSTHPSGVWKSTDKGQSWNKITQLGNGNNAQIVIDNYNPNRIFADSDPLFYRSDDNGNTWITLGLTNAYTIGTVIDNKNNNIIYTGGWGFNPGVYKSINNGISWTSLSNGSKGIINRIVQDSDGTLYISKRGSGAGIWRSTNSGDTWENINDPNWVRSDIWGIDIKDGRLFVRVEPQGTFFADLGTTPTLNPIVFIPGFLGSWSYKGIIENKPTTYSDWILTPVFTDNYYQPLISTLENAGLTKNKNFFTFAYDWRKPIAENAIILNEFLSDEVIPKNPNRKANVVSHSMGGLVVRYCFEKVTGCPDKIDKTITGGTPHSGVLQAYPLWEAGQYDETNPILKVLETIALRVQAPYYLTNKDIIQNKITSIRDLLPVFNYIKGKPYTSMSSLAKNLTLESLLPVTNELTKNLLTFSSTSQMTNSEFVVTSPSYIEKTLGLWNDGKVTKSTKTSGDGTVLATSASLPPATGNQYPVEHKDYLRNDAALKDLLDYFGLSGKPITSIKSTSSFLAFLVHSPVTIQVFDPNNQPVISDPENKYVFLNNPIVGTYRIHVIGSKTGGPFILDAYLTNQLNPVTVRSHQNQINQSEEKDFLFNYSNSPDSDFIIRDVDNLLCVSTSLNSLHDKNIHDVVDNINLQNGNQIANIYLFLNTSLAKKTNPADRQLILQANECLLSLIGNHKNISTPTSVEIKQLNRQVLTLIGIVSIRPKPTTLQAINILLAKDHLDKANQLAKSNKLTLSYLTTKAAAILASN